MARKPCGLGGPSRFVGPGAGTRLGMVETSYRSFFARGFGAPDGQCRPGSPVRLVVRSFVREVARMVPHAGVGSLREFSQHSGPARGGFRVDGGLNCRVWRPRVIDRGGAVEVAPPSPSLRAAASARAAGGGDGFTGLARWRWAENRCECASPRIRGGSGAGTFGSISRSAGKLTGAAQNAAQGLDGGSRCGTVCRTGTRCAKTDQKR